MTITPVPANVKESAERLQLVRKEYFRTVKQPGGCNSKDLDDYSIYERVFNLSRSNAIAQCINDNEDILVWALAEIKEREAWYNKIEGGP